MRVMARTAIARTIKGRNPFVNPSANVRLAILYPEKKISPYMPGDTAR